MVCQTSNCNFGLTRKWSRLRAVPIAVAVASVTAATAAPPKRLGILAGVVCPTPDKPAYWGRMLRSLADRGWIEGRTLVVDCVAAAGNVEQAPELARELVARQPDVLLAASNPTVNALKSATATIPIVTAAADPLQGGIVGSLAHPDANVTGVAPMIYDLVAKRFELLKRILPRLSRVAIVLFGTRTLDQASMNALEAGAAAASRKIGIGSTILRFGSLEELDGTFAHLAAGGFDAVYVFSTPFSFQNRARIAEMALQRRVPTISDNSDFAREGALLSYGLDLSHLVEGTTDYIDKLFRGAKPADLPLRQPTEFDLAINLKTAKALGISVPSSVMILATEVIE